MAEQTHTPPRPRQWLLAADEYGTFDPDEMYAYEMEVNAILRRIGGVVTKAAVRGKVNGHWETTHIAYEWRSFFPTPPAETPEDAADEAADVAEEFASQSEPVMVGQDFE